MAYFTFCDYYIPNNSDYCLPGYCSRFNKLCPYRGQFPELSIQKLTAINQKKCSYYKKWQDPLES